MVEPSLMRSIIHPDIPLSPGRENNKSRAEKCGKMDIEISAGSSLLVNLKINLSLVCIHKKPGKFKFK